MLDEALVPFVQEKRSSPVPIIGKAKKYGPKTIIGARLDSANNNMLVYHGVWRKNRLVCLPRILIIKRHLEPVIEKRKTLDFRTILYLNILLILFLIISGKQEVLLLSFLIAIAAVADMKDFELMAKLVVGFILLQIVHYGLIRVYQARWQASFILLLEIVIFLAQRIYPFIVLGMVLKRSKNLGEITTSLCELRLHKGVILSLIVMIRYLPAIKDDFYVITAAMRIKGIPISFGYAISHPIKAIEYFIVPLLFRSMRTTEEFSGAALVKGYAFNGKRTSYFDVRMTEKDIVMIVLSTFSLAFCAM